MKEAEFFNNFLNLSPALQKEVEDFAAFLKSKYKPADKKKRRVFGSAKGFFKMSPDFDAPLDDFKEYM